MTECFLGRCFAQREHMRREISNSVEEGTEGKTVGTEHEEHWRFPNYHIRSTKLLYESCLENGGRFCKEARGFSHVCYEGLHLYWKRNE